MTKFANKTFSVPVGDTAAYRDNYDAIFGKRRKAATAPAVPADTAESLLREALMYVSEAIRVPDGPAETLAKRIVAFLEGK